MRTPETTNYTHRVSQSIRRRGVSQGAKRERAVLQPHPALPFPAPSRMRRDLDPQTHPTWPDPGSMCALLWKNAQGLRPHAYGTSCFVSQRAILPRLLLQVEGGCPCRPLSLPDASTFSKEIGTQKTPRSLAASMTNFEVTAAPILLEAWMRKLFYPQFSEGNLKLIFISALIWHLIAVPGDSAPCINHPLPAHPPLLAPWDCF